MRFPLGVGITSLSLILQSLAAPAPLPSSGSTTATPSVVVVTQTITDHVTATDHVTVTDHTTQTDIVLETAYLIPSLPACYAQPTGTGAPLIYEPVPTAKVGATGGNQVASSGGALSNSNGVSSSSDSSTGSSNANGVSSSVNSNVGSPNSNDVSTASNGNSPSSSSSSSTGNSASLGNGLTTVSSNGNTGGASATLNTTEGMTGATESAPTLFPIVPPGHDTTHVGTLTPSTNGSYYYTQNGTTDTSIEHLFAEVNTTYMYPTVTIPHTALISSVTCLANGTELAIAFNSTTAYQYAMTHWTVGKEGFLLVTDTIGCSASNDGQHTYWLVSGLTYNDATSTITAKVTELAVADALDNVSLVWGSWTPAGSTPSTPISLPGTVTANTPGTTGNSSSTPGTTSGSSSANSTTPSAESFANLTCANPPASYMGLPTAPCGPDFDAVLDAKIGFLDFTVDPDTDVAAANAAWGDFGGGDEETDLSSSNATRRALQRRVLSAGLVRRAEDCSWYDVPCHARNLANAIVQAPAKIVEAAKDLGTTLVNTAVDVGTGIYDGLKSAANALSAPSFDTTVPINLGPTNGDSPFGPAYLLYHGELKKKNGAEGSLDLYCVQCGITGSAAIHGALDYSILQLSITKAEIGINGNLKAQAALGMHAEGKYEKNYVKNIFSYPVPEAGVKIGNLLVVGVIVSLDATADINISAEADVLAGVSLTIANFNANLDMVDSSKSGVTGFEPTFDKQFSATGSITASIGLGLPVEVGVGIEVPPIPSIGRRVVGLKNTPSVVGTVKAKASISAGGGISERAEDDGSSSDSGSGSDSGAASTATPDNCANSISFSVDIHDKFELDLFGKIIPLVSFDKEGVATGEKCFGSGVISSPPTTPAAPADGSSTDTPADGSSSDAAAPAPADGSSSDSAAAPADGSSSDSAAAPADSSSEASNAAPAERRRSFRFARDLASNSSTVMPVNATSSPSAMNSTSSSPSTAYGNSTAADSVSQQINDSATNETDITDALNQAINGVDADKSANATDGLSYGSIVDFSGKYVLGVSDDGNFYIDTVSNQAQTIGFAFSESVAVEDEEGDLLFYYPDEMKALGVSRFRATDIEHIPKSSDIISLKPINYDNAAATPGVFLAVDSKLNNFVTILCNFAGGLDSKIFLASSIAEGVATLKKPELQYVITGGPVTDCAPIAFKSDFAGY
ncbi:hypothetical protein QFC22_000678 [Naganishia vaughanmartiniae]|uniref:Uncharacterized protein n=1 Tax=Naganishia vaughanmartiniae TaxID=1424756 RepID=A0ACC2XJV2_9TREE|nr:hypothetical protein QFC22_000678 [Naganishia vaughanmartiniae]